MNVLGVIAMLAAGAAVAQAAACKEIPNHTCVYATVTVRDTRGAPADAAKAKVRLLRATGAWELAHLDPFERRATGGGVYQGVLPMNHEDEMHAYVIEIAVDGYHAARLPARRFRRPASPEEEGSQKKPYAFQAVVLRDSKRWRPVMGKFGELPERLRLLLEHAIDLEYLPLRGSPVKVGRMTAQEFQSPRVADESGFRLAQAALLNIYALASGEQPLQTGVSATAPCGDGQPITRWVEYVQELRRIGQERVVARVDPGMFDRVKAILENPDPGECERYAAADSSQHARSFEGLVLRQDIVSADMVSVKGPACRGSLQLTVVKYILQNGCPRVYADIDIDQNRALLHAGDVFVHMLLNRGTHPILIYDLLGALPAMTNPGYRVVRAD